MSLVPERGRSTFWLITGLDVDPYRPDAFALAGENLCWVPLAKPRLRSDRVIVGPRLKVSRRLAEVALEQCFLQIVRVKTTPFLMA